MLKKQKIFYEHYAKKLYEYIRYCCISIKRLTIIREYELFLKERTTLQHVMSIVGIVVTLAVAYIFSYDRKQVKLRPIIQLIILQLIFGFLLMNTKLGNIVVGGIAQGFEYLLNYAKQGVDFVFAGITNKGAAPFFLTVLLPIVFISALIGILQHFRILPLLMKGIGWLLSKVNGLGKLESYNGIASAILGQSEVFISVKDQLPYFNEKRMYTLCATAMSTVSMSIVGSYMTMIEPAYVVTALVLNLFGSFIIVQLINPYELDPSEDILEVEQADQSFFEMLGEYILAGFHVAINVAAMLIGFIALIAMLNAIFHAIFGLTFQELLGYIFAPFAFLSGIPWSEAVDAGNIMATKLVSNEFVAMSELKQLMPEFSARSQAILSTFLVSFANFSSIGIISGAVGSLDAKQGKIAAKFGLKLLFGATLVSFLTASVVGLLFI